MLSKAIVIAVNAFDGVFDKGGSPYILHCLRVMNKVMHRGEQAMIAAILHDLIEDTDWTKEMLLKEGFNPVTVSWIDILTHDQDTPYMRYIQDISVHEVPRAIKMADLEDNSDINRLKGLRDKDFERMRKYHTAFNLLKHSFTC